MNFWNTVRVAWKAILTNKSRSFLTMLGIIIGVGSVILLTSIGNGMQSYITDQFEDLGANTVSIIPAQIFGEGGGFSGGEANAIATAVQFDMRAVRDLEKKREFFTIVLPESEKRDNIAYRNTTKRSSLLATTQDYPEMRSTEFLQGRFFTEREAEAGERVAALGSKIAVDLFGGIDPVGKTIRIGDVTFTVVGVAEEKGGSFGGPTFDEYVFIPMEAYFRMYDTDEINSISAQVRETDQIEPAIEEINDYFSNVRNRKDDTFEAFDQRQILETINQILGVLTVGLGGIAAISLVVGGIGIMNIMLVSVTERTREIGLRKALGATPNQILVQFLIESSLLSVMGGAIGVAIAAAFSYAIVVFADFPSKVTPDAVALAFGVSSIVGLVFGVAPARQASKLSPIEALRSE